MVSLFINHNVNQKSMMPAVLINGEKFFVSLFDCVKDILLISDPITYVTYEDNNQGALNRMGLTALAVVVHHETTLLSPPDINMTLKSGVIDKLRNLEHLECFQNLEDMNVDVSRLQMCLSTMFSFETKFISQTELKKTEDEKEEEKRKRTNENEQGLPSKRLKI